MEYIDQINHINSLLQELETKIVYMQDNVKKVNSSSSSNTTDITAITEKVNSLTTSINTIQINISNLQSSTTSNATEISSIKTTLSSISNQIETLNSQIATLTTTTNTNSTNISNLQEQVTQNTTSISEINESLTQINNSITQINSTLQELQNSGGGGCECEEQLTTISTKVNNMETIVNNFTTLIKDRNAAIDTTYTQIDPDTVVQTYDCMEKRFDFYGNGTFNSGLFEFCVQEGTTACTLNIITTLTSNTNTETQAVVSLYFNGSTTPIIQNISINNSLTTQITTFDLSISTTGNFFYFTIHPEDSSTEINFNYAKVEVTNCTNPILLNKICPFSVDYFNGKYYLTDCTGEYAKIAEINTSDIATINDVEWTTTTFKAQGAITSSKLIKTTTPYTVDSVARFYLLTDCTIVCDSETFTEPKTYTGTKFSYIANNYLNTKYSCIVNSLYSSNLIRVSSVSLDPSTNYLSLSSYTTNNEIAYYGGTKTNKDTFHKEESSLLRAVQQLNGKATMRYSNKILELTQGRILHCYSGYDANNNYQYTIYVNVYNKVVKFVVGYNYNLTLISSAVVGDYDNYFEGVDNDYFVVKNNKLYYYKDNLQSVVE